MPSLKAIRKRITSVQSTQKITRAMKMVAGARFTKAQQRITELRPYAKKAHQVLAAVAAAPTKPAEAEVEQAAAEAAEGGTVGWTEKPAHPLLVERAEKRVLLLVLTSDRGLCGAFNTNINKRAEREWRERTANGQEVKFYVVGRKGRDYLTRRGAPITEFLSGVWEKVSIDGARAVGQKILAPFNAGEVDAIYIVYNEFKSAMSQMVVCERLLPVPPPPGDDKADEERLGADDFLFEPNREALLEQLVPMYVDISLLRAMFESQASELGAKMTAMDAATKNAKEMIGSLTLQYNKARQASITKELMEIIGGSEALKE